MDIATYLDMYSDARNLLYMNVPDSFLIDSRLILVTPDQIDILYCDPVIVPSVPCQSFAKQKGSSINT